MGEQKKTISNIQSFDVIVIGGGHAGIEAAHASAKLGCSTALITIDPHKIGWMPCNPAIGGIGKGHIVFEISALGGLMPKLSTKSYLQVRMLNTSKGPAVQGLRLQIDKIVYQQLAQKALEEISNLTIVKAFVEDLVIENKKVKGVKIGTGETLFSPTVVITTGTFLNGITHIGQLQKQEGRRLEPAATHLSNSLRKNSISLGRLKTGTPPRLDKHSIDFDRMIKQDDMVLDYLFEFYPHHTISSHPCYITQTNTNTHEIIRNNLKQSPMYSGQILSRGPRYCPSIEDKISRFPTKESHQIFVEPESAHLDDIYPNGISTGLPLEVQEQYIRSIAGFERAIITKSGYAVEYDFVFPNQLKHSLETKEISGLFCAGQINGTTGYEEAAGQGIIAGINAARFAQKKEPFTLARHESYIGVMIDDLVTMSIDEPYRMFTSRAEHRLLLRQDNAFFRLSPKAYDIGMLEEKLYRDICYEHDLVKTISQKLKTKFTASTLNQFITQAEDLRNAVEENTDYQVHGRLVNSVYAELLYEPYFVREQKEIEKTKQYQALTIPATLDFNTIEGLSIELRQKLSKHKPNSIAQAMLIPGMTPAAISLLIFYVRMRA
ncbi:MAG TPA: tRNA uridine-5-carboxymethylaminomethyl(34) synthesis enzyme MnmG [Candidatus Babeliales bacterium]|nr:tRNA uridine-5-carboxymethylaminomethyl(34) synthesis enzyme MnmG [Candidatus Babeliales bacterium]